MFKISLPFWIICQNKKRGEELVISTPDSKVKVLVVPTDEELMIARDVERLKAETEKA